MRERKERQVCVFLPNKQRLQCTVGVNSRGQEVLDHVSSSLGVKSLTLFGLSLLREDEYLFLDLDQKLRKYFGKAQRKGRPPAPFALFLRVQFYVASGELLTSRVELELLYVALRQQVLETRCRHQEALIFQAAAAALQAELGEVEVEVEEEEEEEVEVEVEDGGGGGGEEKKGKTEGYFLPEDYFPPWLIRRRGRGYLLRHTPAAQAELRGVSRERAVQRFIGAAVALQDGALTCYRMSAEKEGVRRVLLAVALRGVHVYQDVDGKRCLRYDFSWTDIQRLTVQGRRLELHAVGSLCLPKLVYYTASTLHSSLILRHLRQTHLFHIHSREAHDAIRRQEEARAPGLHREAYVCDAVALREKLRSIRGGDSLSSSMSDSRVAMTTRWRRRREEGGSAIEVEMSVDEPEEVLVDDPTQVPWLVDLSRAGGRADGPPVLRSSCWAEINMEMKQALRRRPLGALSVD